MVSDLVLSSGKKIVVSIFLLFVTGTFTSNELLAQEPQRTSIFEELFRGPKVLAERDNWLRSMRVWRENEKKDINYRDAWYSLPELSWAAGGFIFPQVMAHDRYLYSETQKKYTVKRYLEDVAQRYGGIDGVLVWPTYPNIGVDDRNQFDLISAMPGGIEGVKQMIADFHKEGVRVFFPIMIWDHGTRKIKLSMAVKLIMLMKQLGADGLNGDTMLGVTEDFKNAADSLSYPLTFEPEVYLKDLKMIEWNIMSWGYWWKSWTDPNYDYEPGVSVYKWLEPRHMVNVTNRWATDKTNDLQYAFFNGVGYNPWENIWGVWNPVSKRDGEAIRRIAAIYRQFPRQWSSPEWEPYIPTLQSGVFASSFFRDGKTIYTIINRDSTAKVGEQLQLPYKKDLLYFDLWNGKKVEYIKNKKSVRLDFPIENRGFSAILAIPKSLFDSTTGLFINSIRERAANPVNNLSSEWTPLKQEIVKTEKTRSDATVAENMILIPAIKNYLFESGGVFIEGDNLPRAAGVQYPWEEHPVRSTKHVMNIASFLIDKYPVSNKQFKAFLDDSKYQPEDSYNFLKDWKAGTYPAGWENKPVTWVSIEDARAYALWAGKRLPHEWEWQYAAQGTDNRLYPWGNNWDPRRVPDFDSSRSAPVLRDVDDFPQGKSVFGVMDLVGHIWQWTDEYRDPHTRFAVVKGGSCYRPTTSGWYFPQAHQLDKYGKYLLMSPGLDRSGMIGFRCVRDVSQ